MALTKTMIPRKVDVLCISTKTVEGRNTGMLVPVLYYCEKVLGLTTFCGAALDARYWLDKLNPHLLLVTDAKGDKNYFKALKYAKKRNIPMISLTAEGDKAEDYIRDIMWGSNPDKTMYEDLNIQWTNRIKNLTIKYHPKLEGKLIAAGGLGFDRYKIYNFMTRKEFVSKYNKKSYKKIICVAGWGFHKHHGSGPYYNKHYSTYLRRFGEKQLKIFREDRKKLNLILKQLIRKHKDILFILKYHPGGTKESRKLTEFENLGKYENTIELQHEESISDCINVSDLLIAYESTSAMEAWLLGKQTFLVNPTTADFIRSRVHKGSPILKTYEQCDEAINTFYKTGKVPGFAAKSPARKKAIKDIIGWNDGKNHIRTGKIIGQFLEQTKNRRIKKAPLLPYLRHYAKYALFNYTRLLTKNSLFKKAPIRKMRFLAYCQSIFSYEAFDKLKAKYYPQLDRFHQNLSRK